MFALKELFNANKLFFLRFYMIFFGKILDRLRKICYNNSCKSRSITFFNQKVVQSVPVNELFEVYNG